jgi:hypothetical protein
MVLPKIMAIMIKGNDVFTGCIYFLLVAAMRWP